jgi:S-DNA-T family DNA segregation ATPase FtsK/SpoIIIE
VIVFGAGGSGKSSVLVSTAFALAASSSPAELRVYGLDGTRGSLTAVDELPHCGGVIAMDDEERVDRLLRALLAEIDSPSGRRTVVLLDDLGSFQTIHDKPGGGTSWANLQAVLAGGRAAAVHVICTASRRGALPPAMAAHVGQRLALRMPTDDDLVGLGLESKKVRGAKLPPGRGFTQESEEFQVARPDRALAIQAAGGFDGVGPRAATRISTLPATISRADLGPSASRERLLIGISDATLSPATIDLRDGHFVVVGPYRSGRSTALATIALAIRAAAPDVELFLLSPRRTPLRDLDLWKAVAAGVETCRQAIDGLLERAESSDAAGRPAVVVIDDAGELSEPIVSSRLERILKAGRDGAVTVVAAVETSGARGIAAPWIREARREGHGLLLQPDLLGDGDLLNAKLPRRVAAPLIPGRGFVVSRGTPDLVHLAA